MPSPTRSLRIEALESRTLPATASLFQGTLSVIGTAAADTITIKQQAGRLVVVGTPIQVGGLFVNSVGLGGVNRVFVAGGFGNDSIDVATVSKKATIIGGPGSDRVTGGLGADDFYGRDGNDTISGGAGNDSVYGENGDDTLTGDDGGDFLFAGNGNDSLSGGAGDDILYGEAGSDVGNGGDGNDTLRGNVGSDQLNGGAGDDEFYGEEGNDSLDGGSGNDTMSGGQGNDRGSGGSGDDFILGENGIDTLHGDDGNDIVGGGPETDFVFGDLGNDIVAGGDVPDFIDGGPGDDTVGGDGEVVDGGGGTDTVIGGGGDTGGNPGGGNGGGSGGGSNGTGTVLQAIRAQWTDGSTNDITVRNTGSSALNGWKVEFEADFEITSVWNAQLVEHTGNHYTFRNLPGHWATTIRPNNQITFGFNARLDADDTTNIHDIELNDQPLPSNGGNGNGGTAPATGTTSQTVRSEWPTGSTHDIAVRNAGTTPISGWTVSFDADFEITEVWNAQIVGRVGNRYTIRNIPNAWNARIAANTSITFGFNTRLDVGDSTEIRIVSLTANNQ